jgi:hypothetical protein
VKWVATFSGLRRLRGQPSLIIERFGGGTDTKLEGQSQLFLKKARFSGKLFTLSVADVATVSAFP